ncbi:tetratricopeptide repeat protein 4 homolog [Rhodamnia argentea]|uniref:Tetratricopeptide repeat protein 4 homolog n=1 Tax=Rhodamnia argentea TaxID=178133 RepID=A0A8B8NZI0_9MYRT|nr:tetratricopeptide repeat protein 4 homolog [Rhodamnia argentea]
MALWMEKGSQPQTESEIADLDAIAALKESAALELKEKGNEYVKLGKKHYSNAIDCYTRAINQKALSDSENSVLFANRAHVNLLLGNYRRALTDAEEAINLCPTNVKAFYRAAKASLLLNLLNEAKLYCENGLEKDPSNEELKKLAKKVESNIMEHQSHDAEVSNAVTVAKGLVSAIEARKLKMGKAMYRELTGLKKPVLDKDNILHWPVLLLYAEVMSSDFIEDFCETDMFSVHLDLIFSVDSPPLPWDTENKYTRDAIELYYEASSGTCLSAAKLLRYFLEGTAGANVELPYEDENATGSSSSATISAGDDSANKWIRVNEKRTLHDVLRESRFIIPGIPVFFVVSRRSSFYQVFKSGKWTPH